jgi:hypothetical protein
VEQERFGFPLGFAPRGHPRRTPGRERSIGHWTGSRPRQPTSNRRDHSLRATSRRTATYSSFATFRDPDGNGWLLQEVTTRLPGRIDAAETAFASAADLAGALRRAAAAHGEHEKLTGEYDAGWPDWYAAYMVAERAGTELPT